MDPTKSRELLKQLEGHCECVVKNREPGEEQREWLKRWMCMFHWMQTDYYLAKLMKEGHDAKI
jgi:hypothetical protein